jgi:hypothetical protein
MTAVITMVTKTNNRWERERERERERVNGKKNWQVREEGVKKRKVGRNNTQC